MHFIVLFLPVGVTPSQFFNDLIIYSTWSADQRAVQHLVRYVLTWASHMRNLQQREGSHPGEQQSNALHEANRIRKYIIHQFQDITVTKLFIQTESPISSLDNDITRINIFY